MILYMPLLMQLLKVRVDQPIAPAKGGPRAWNGSRVSGLRRVPLPPAMTMANIWDMPAYSLVVSDNMDSLSGMISRLSYRFAQVSATERGSGRK